MKKLLIVMALLFSVSALRAEPAKDWKSWYNNMLKGLRSKVERKLESKHRVSAVAAVRGAKQGEDANALYWKGGLSDKARKKLDEEKKQLTGAVELVVNGDTEGGRAALNKFLKDNPESFFAADAKEALANLPAPEAKPAEEKPAAAEAAAPSEQPAQEKTDK
ncbi:MAG TPA: hypothetical protein DCW72_10290 [Elusimicrobia bacterium]|nr:MAG: hypothetical protein A2X29_12285 [Elusimicrobia bacterium GWA2_64_40]OGR64460.1 MAG: hypothetical protein A2X30_00025 [Elusimicrobia bacterium GWB2_63_16]HAN04172.1 hypothetical protein [Elusimicrobiota bacterium]HAU90569.1 hypothetical protein [Elusimicrobiota bacterium]